MIKRILTGFLAACMLPAATVSAQQTPANLDEAIVEFTRVCMADQTQYFDSYAQAETSCACSLGMSGGYFNEADFISYLVLLQELLKHGDLSTDEQFDSFVNALLARGFDEEKIIDFMAAAEELGEIEVTYCGAYWE
ncbi:hypothetical protein FF098_012590 [Parvularcula flava]|uniref:Uncharacterized protein n=1 Tax=Aquisalinus luteolus TaxID=1566827 RepID=A0A8J3EV56_9PROT|nr:hypothetical protein [Aquisalinus luteolus]NHK28750.1 hypothetical protein [Aquisalinus luteolus]GGH99407.1 hypothetical protein GCM10011355_25290 [Aquisalinus luteolus]